MDSMTGMDDTQAAEEHLVINSYNRIIRYLKEIHRLNLDLHISPADAGDKAGNEESYTTRIRKIDMDSGGIVLHRLQCADGGEGSLPPDSEVSVSCTLPGGAIRFKAMISSLDESGSVSYCVMSFPHQVDRRQLRAFFRVSLGTYDSHLAIRPEGSQPLQAQLMDLSLGGMLCHFKSAKDDFSRGGFLQCRLHVADLLDLECFAHARHVHRIDHNTVQMGLKFIDLSPRQVKAIRKAIATVERRNIRRDKVDGAS